jgi:hypothetical protein
MVEVDVQTVSIAIASASVTLAAFYYMWQIRHQTRTRKTDLVIRLNATWGSKDIMEAWSRVMERDIKEYDTSSLSMSSKWVPEMQIAQFFEELGYLVHSGFADFEFIYALFPVGATWGKLRFLVARIRESRNNPTYYEWFEYLYNEVKKREQKLQQTGAK